MPNPKFVDKDQNVYQPRSKDVATGITLGDTVPRTIIETGQTQVDRSGTIAVASASQQIMAANPLRLFFDFQCNSADCYLNKVGGAASGTGGSIFIPAGSLYESAISGCSTSAINVMSAAVGAIFTSSEG